MAEYENFSPDHSHQSFKASEADLSAEFTPDVKEPVIPVFIATDSIQTIPHPDHPLADEVEHWFLNGGRPPVLQSELPTGDALLADESGVEFPRVIEALEEVRGAAHQDHSPSRLRRAGESIKETVKKITRPHEMRPGREYRPSGD